MAKKNYYTETLKLLTELHKQHPTYNMGKHISTATDEYGNIWSMNDKSLYEAIKKYSDTLQYDTQPEPSIEAIIADAVDLRIGDEEDDY